MLVVVSYDVSTKDAAGRRRLRRVAKACTNKGYRVQYSVFECLVDPAEWTVLRSELLGIIDPTQDGLRFFFLGSNWRKRIECHGTRQPIEPGDPIVL